MGYTKCIRTILQCIHCIYRGIVQFKNNKEEKRRVFYSKVYLLDQVNEKVLFLYSNAYEILLTNMLKRRMKI